MTLTTGEATQEKIYYPETDGEPMAESDFQRKPLMYMVEALDLYFEDRPDVYVSGNLLIYYEEGNPRASVAPDVFVVFGVPKRERPIYQIWREGKSPDVVIEITSRTTRYKDQVEKAKLYSRLGVKEYFQYDPTGDYLQPALRVRWLDQDGSYQELQLDQLSDETLVLESQLLGVELHLKGNRLRLFDPTRQDYLRTYQEAEAQIKIETQARLAEEQARYQAEERIKELEAEVARLKAENGDR